MVASTASSCQVCWSERLPAERNKHSEDLPVSIQRSQDWSCRTAFCLRKLRDTLKSKSNEDIDIERF